MNNVIKGDESMKTHISLFHYRAALLASGMLLACGSNDPEVPQSPNGGPIITSDGGSLSLPSGGSCTLSHTVCVDLQMPETLNGKPTWLRISYRDRLPPQGPPSGMGGAFEAPDVQPGQLVHAQLGDADL